MDGEDRVLEVHRSGCEQIGELLRDRSHPRRGDRDLTTEERPQDQAHHATRGGEVGIEEDPGEERREEPVDDPLREAQVSQVLPRGDVLRGGDVLPAGSGQLGPELEQADQVARRRDPGRQGGGGLHRRLEGIGDRAHAPVGEHLDARCEPLQVEPSVVELATGLGIAREQHLEAAIEQVAVDLVGADATADPVAGLEHDHTALRPGEVDRRGEPGQPGSDDDHVRALSGGSGHG